MADGSAAADSMCACARFMGAHQSQSSKQHGCDSYTRVTHGFTPVTAARVRRMDTGQAWLLSVSTAALPSICHTQAAHLACAGRKPHLHGLRHPEALLRARHKAVAWGAQLIQRVRKEAYHPVALLCVLAQLRAVPAGVKPALKHTCAHTKRDLDSFFSLSRQRC
jgi:hypothetical protein